MKKLYRSRDNKILGGVCMGIANYFGVDVTLIRLLWIVVGFWGGIGFPAYIVAWIIIPEEPAGGEAIDITPGQGSRGADTRTIGLIIVAVGLYLLLRQFIPTFFFEMYFWPLLIVAIGLFVMFGGFRGDK